MLPLQHGALWRTLTGLLLILVLVAAVAPAYWFDSRVEATTWFRNADKWLHATTFTVLAIWLAGLLHKDRYWLIALGLLLFGGFLETCQYLIGYRTADWFDMAANAVGIIVGLAVSMAGLGGWGLVIENWYAKRLEH